MKKCEKKNARISARVAATLMTMALAAGVMGCGDSSDEPGIFDRVNSTDSESTDAGNTIADLANASIDAYQIDQDFLTSIAMIQSEEVYNYSRSPVIQGIGLSESLYAQALQTQEVNLNNLQAVYLLQGGADVLTSVMMAEGIEISDDQREILEQKSSWSTMFVTQMLSMKSVEALAASTNLSQFSCYPMTERQETQYVVVLVNNSGYATMTGFAPNERGIMTVSCFPYFSFDEDTQDAFGMIAQQYQVEITELDTGSLNLNAKKEPMTAPETFGTLNSESIKRLALEQLALVNREGELGLMQFYTTDDMVNDVASQMSSVTEDNVDETYVISGTSSVMRDIYAAAQLEADLSDTVGEMLEQKYHWSQYLISSKNSEYGTQNLAAATSLQLTDIYLAEAEAGMEYLVLMIDKDGEYSMAVSACTQENGIMVVTVSPIMTQACEELLSEIQSYELTVE